jgi:hypothetical protein
MSNLESRVAALEEKFASFDAFGLPDFIAAVRAGMAAQGWDRFPSIADLGRAFAAGASAETLLSHFAAVLAKYASPQDASGAGHGANLRIDKSLAGLLAEGNAVGYTAWSASEDEQRALFGFTQADIDAASSLPENRHKLITDFPLFKATGGELGWRPRAGDPRGRSSDDDLYGGRS